MTKKMLLAFLIALICAASSTCFASVEPSGDEATASPSGEVTKERDPLALGLIAISAALAVGITAMATGIAQSRIGAAGCGTISEKPETVGTIILLVAIPETMVILGFVVAIVLLFVL